MLTPERATELFVKCKPFLDDAAASSLAAIFAEAIDTGAQDSRRRRLAADIAQGRRELAGDDPKRRDDTENLAQDERRKLIEAVKVLDPPQPRPMRARPLMPGFEKRHPDAARIKIV